jgi:hypothetical protein
MSYVPNFLGLFSKHSRVKTTRPLHEQYENFEKHMHAKGMFETTKEFYDNLSKDSNFIKDGDREFDHFLNSLAPHFNKAINEKKEYEKLALSNVSDFLELINNNDLSNKKENNKIVDDFYLLTKKIQENNNPDTKYIEQRLITNAFYEDFVEKLMKQIPGDMESFTVNRGGNDHLSFINSFKANKISRNEYESLCSPKKDFMKEVSNGYINGAKVSCRKCIKGIISLVAKPTLKNKPKMR